MTSYINSSCPGRVWWVTSRLGTGISKSFFYVVTLRRWKYLRKQRLQGERKSGQRFLPSPNIHMLLGCEPALHYFAMFAHSASLSTPSKQNIQGCSNPCCISNCFFLPTRILNCRKSTVLMAKNVIFFLYFFPYSWVSLRWWFLN